MEELFARDDINKVWQMRNKLHKHTNEAIERMTSDFTKGIPLSRFSELPFTEDRQSRIRRALQRALYFNQVSCKDCGELTPGWIFEEDEGGKLALKVDLEFQEAGRFYGVHADHDGHPPDGYIVPGQLFSHNSDKAKRQLLWTDQRCPG